MKKDNDIIICMVRAIIAFLACYGLRSSALRSLTFGCIDPVTLEIHQNPLEGVMTKYLKDIHTFCFRFHPKLVGYIKDWITICEELGCSRTDPLFPRLAVCRDENGVFGKAKTLTREFMLSKGTLNRILKDYADKADMKYFSAHQYRHCSCYYALRAARNALELKAVATQFGHKSINLVLATYGNLSYTQVKEVIGQMDFEVQDNNFGTF